MDSASTDILVVLLSIGMSIVLLFAIIALYYTIKVMRNLKSITDRAEHIAENVDNVSEFFKTTAGPVAITKLIANIVEAVRSKSDRKDK